MRDIEQRLSAMGVRWFMLRGKYLLDDMFVDRIVDGVPVNLQRRRYSNCTFCWAEAYINGKWVSLGDPWQKVTPSAAELTAEIQRRIPVESEVPCGL